MIEINQVTLKGPRLNGMKIQYRAAGKGSPVLLVHGWPTSSFLWRNVMPWLAEHHRVIAVDLPGFGGSDKPLDRVFNNEFHLAFFDEFLDALGISEPLGLAVHDLGGPVALYWASQRPGRLSKLAILNTIVYPEMSLFERAFLLATRVPGLRAALASQWGLRRTLRFGIKSAARLRPDAMEGFVSPFVHLDSRTVLLRTLAQFEASALDAIAQWVPTIDVPVQIIRGAHDRILPKMDQTAARLLRELPQAKEHVFDDCGHFLQEERPDEIGKLLATFFGA